MSMCLEISYHKRKKILVQNENFTETIRFEFYIIKNLCNSMRVEAAKENAIALQLGL